MKNGHFQHIPGAHYSQLTMLGWAIWIIGSKFKNKFSSINLRLKAQREIAIFVVT